MLERMLVGKIENRITVGILSFLGIMVLLGWAAINEGGRMQAFTEAEHARSIEQGAALFASQCATCHGEDGRGKAGRAPGLNNPQFFGHDFFPDITSQIATLIAERTTLTAESAAQGTPEERKTEINSRILVIDTQIEDLNAQRTPAVQAAIDAGYNPQSPSRLANLGWAGTHDSFVLTTLIHGRPVSINYWPQAMPAWSQTAGGPMRMDQLEYLVAYIENWDKGEEWTLEDLFAVKQFAIQPADPAPLLFQIQQLQQSGGMLPEQVGTDVAAILTRLPEFTGDAARGDELYHGLASTQFGNRLACTGCHSPEANGVGPMLNGTFTRVQNDRLNDPALAGYTAEQYLVQSIVLPSAYIVPTFNDAMQKNFGELLSYQDMADIIAYLETLNQ
ncbi:MAG: c-type cytochrome [Anaerolineae bacterium]|nr:c-type cytochrome [Anaerolineae bacterium]